MILTSKAQFQHEVKMKDNESNSTSKEVTQNETAPAKPKGQRPNGSI